MPFCCSGGFNGYSTFPRVPVAAPKRDAILAREAVDLAKGKSREDLDGNRMLQLSLIRLVEVVGEAAARVSDETASNYPQIPWPQIRSMRNRLIHGYDFVDYDILWQTVKEDLPALVAALERLSL